jgi:predicted dehydrogenase
MKSLVIGLGSMGKRRIRCLKSLGYNDITGYDPKPERREETWQKYSIKVDEVYDVTKLDMYDAIIISTPPDCHYKYAADAVLHNIPCFLEASVLAEDVDRIKSKMISGKAYVAPSCTLKFHPVIQKIKGLVKSGIYGKITNYTYHCGQYLHDWHPWEKITDYYVSNRETGAAREIVPFELTWLTDILGFPKQVKGYFAETLKFEKYIENTYVFSLKHDDFLGSITVDVVSRFATRNLILNLERAQIRWNWEENGFKIYDPSSDRWEFHKGIESGSAVGYNKNIIEEMYVREIEAFLRGIEIPSAFPNNLENDSKILGLLNQIENSDGGFARFQ